MGQNEASQGSNRVQWNTSGLCEDLFAWGEVHLQAPMLRTCSWARCPQATGSGHRKEKELQET